MKSENEKDNFDFDSLYNEGFLMLPDGLFSHLMHCREIPRKVRVLLAVYSQTLRYRLKQARLPESKISLIAGVSRGNVGPILAALEKDGLISRPTRGVIEITLNYTIAGKTGVKNPENKPLSNVCKTAGKKWGNPGKIGKDAGKTLESDCLKSEGVLPGNCLKSEDVLPGNCLKSEGGVKTRVKSRVKPGYAASNLRQSDCLKSEGVLPGNCLKSEDKNAPLLESNIIESIIHREGKRAGVLFVLPRIGIPFVETEENKEIIKILIKSYRQTELSKILFNVQAYFIDQNMRRYTISKSMKSILKNIHIFVSMEEVEKRITKEKEWFLEHSRKNESENIKTSVGLTPEEQLKHFVG